MNIPEMLVAAKSAYDLLAVGVAARDQAKVDAAMADLRQELTSAISMSLAQVRATHALELEVQQLRMESIQAQARYAEMERQLEKRSQYVLSEVSPGKWVRELLETGGDAMGRPKYFCATCYSDGKEVPLQFSAESPYFPATLKCRAKNGHDLSLKQNELAAARLA